MSHSLKLDACEMKYKLGRTLGEGSFSVVKLAVDRETKKKWAVKIIKQTKLNDTDRAAITTEISLLRKMDHKNIVCCKEIIDTASSMYIIMEVMSGGELFDRIIAKDYYSERGAIDLVKQLVSAIAYCHKLDIVHRDLKPENLLFASVAEDAPLKLADFGLAVLLKPNQFGHSACGTPGYVAPEVLATKTKGNKQGYGKEVDLWSLGVIIYILLCGFPPFYHESNSVLFELIQRADYSFPEPYWDDVSEPAKDLIRNLLVLDPSKRLTAPQVLQHHWLSDENTTACSNNMIHFKEQMKAFNARTRLKKAIHAVTFLNRVKKITGASPAAEAPAAQAAAVGATENASSTIASTPIVVPAAK